MAQRVKGRTATGWSVRKIGLSVLALTALVAIPTLPYPVDPEQRAVLAVLIATAILWFGEVMPLFVTALLVPVLLSIMTALPTTDLTEPFFDPIIALFFGSFVVATALAKHGWANWAATLVVRVARGRPRVLLLTIMVVVVIIDAWISNTATVALLVPLITTIVTTNNLRERSPRYAVVLYLGLAFATAIGSMATPVGTPPNAIAVRFLAEEGIVLSFVDWMRIGLPIALTLLPITWLLLILFGSPKVARLKYTVGRNPIPRTTGALVSLGVLVLMVGMWVSEPLHNIEPAMVSLLGVVALFSLRALEPGDLAKVPFSTLLMFGGGLVLGDAVRATGLVDVLAGSLGGALAGSALLPALAVLGVTAVALTTFASNTAMAAILVPLVLGVAAQTGLPVLPLVMVATLALSVDFISPVGTPPSTIVYGEGRLRVSDFVRVGLPVTIVSLAVVVLYVALLA